MPVLVTAGMTKTLRHMFGGALNETYTRIPILPVVDGDGAPVVDAWGQPLTENGTPVVGGPCKLRVIETVNRDDRGAMLIRRPFLWVRHDEPIAVGDLVREVRDGEGRLLLSQAAVVRVEPSPVGTGSITIAVELEGAEAVPLPAPEGA